MKFNFKKISAIGTSLLMAGMSIGVATAANYPAPFVVDGVADVAIVYGTGAGVSQLDLIQAGNIQTDLQSGVKGDSVSTVTGGDSYMFEKTSTKFHLGDNITSVVSSSLDEDELPSLLADGTYTDDDNDDFDFTQKITLSSNLQLGMFEDNDYKADEPTVGFKINNGANVLSYTLEFTEEPLFSDLETTDLTLMGKDYYVLQVTTSSITLLDSATDTVLSEGETATVSGKTVSIEFVSDTEAKLNVDGEITNSLSEGETYKLNDGTYIGMKDILYSSKDTGVSKVEFSIGNGKLVLDKSGAEVKMNDDTIDGLTSTWTNTTADNTLADITLTWNADDELFVTEDSEITMPGFEAVKLSYGGLELPAEETIEVAAGGDTYIQLKSFPLKDSTEDINLLYATTAGSWVGMGKDSDNRLVTAAAGVNLTFDGDTDDYFVVSYSDGRDAESYLVRANNFKTENSENKTTIEYKKDGSWTEVKSDRKEGDTFSIGNAELKLGAIDKDLKTVVFSNNSAQTSFDKLYSAEGLMVYLPVEAGNTTGTAGAINFSNGVAGHNPTSFDLTMVEEDKDGDKGDGDQFNITLGWNGQSPSEAHVSDIEGEEVAFSEIDDSDVYRAFMYSALATEFLYDKGPDQDTVKVIYHGEEVAASVYVTSAEATLVSSGSSALGEILVKDSEVASVSDKNLVIVGGSCINSAAASVLGGAYCGAAFTEATGVASDQFMIKGFEGTSVTSKLALVVAGYNQADTTNAVTYLRTQDVDTMSEYLGTSSTSAELVVA